MGTRPIFESDFDCLTATMSDISDPEDEIIEIAPKPKPQPPQQQQRQCGAQQRRQPPTKPAGVDKWPAIYTTYLNVNRTRAQGRLVPKAFGVNNPGFHEIKDVLMEAGFQIWLEDKVHPRELDPYPPMGYPNNYPPPHRGNSLRGRIKYKLRDDQGEFATKFTSKAEVLRHVGEMIPKLKTRIEINRIMDEHKKAIEQERKEAEKAAAKKQPPKSKPKGKSKKGKR